MPKIKKPWKQSFVVAWILILGLLVSGCMQKIQEQSQTLFQVLARNGYVQVDDRKIRTVNVMNTFVPTPFKIYELYEQSDGSQYLLEIYCSQDDGISSHGYLYTNVRNIELDEWKTDDGKERVNDIQSFDSDTTYNIEYQIDQDNAVYHVTVDGRLIE